MTEPLASHDFQAGDLLAALVFFRRTRDELRSLRKVRVYTDRVQLFDINGDYFQLTGIGYPDADIVAILKSFDTPFQQSTIHDPIDGPYKEFMTGRRYPWAADRVM